MADSSYLRLKAQSDARQAAQDRQDSLRRSVLVLILDHLQTEGYAQVVQMLETATKLSLQTVAVADNIDLNEIVSEFSAYYALKHGRAPKLTRRVGPETAPTSAPQPSSTAAVPSSTSTTTPKSRAAAPDHSKGSPAAAVRRRESDAAASKTKSASSDGSRGETALAPKNIESIAKITASSLDNVAKGTTTPPPWLQHWQKTNGGAAPPAVEAQPTLAAAPAAEPVIDEPPRIRRAIPLYASDEQQELAAIIERDIFTANPNVRMDDIVGLDDAKRLVKEAVVYPIRYPELFSGLLDAWRGILLFGPPGTGKTMLAKAVATECHTTFFNIGASSIVSKWRGDSEKLVRMLFEMARHYAPSIIFVDELESLMSQRSSGSADSEHEGSLRLKTELLVQLDGLCRLDARVVLLAATNLPWRLDPALLRRLDKRIMVGLPDAQARTAMLRQHLESRSAGLDFDQLALRTEGYSGSDLRLVCKEAAMRPVRKVVARLEALESASDPTHGLVPVSPVDASAVRQLVAPVTQDDVFCALSSTRPACSLDNVGEYSSWAAQFGSL